MTKPGRWQHRAETKERIAAKQRARFADPAERQRVSEATKARMADPAVRQRIRDGMARAAEVTDAVQPLRAAWFAASPEVRKRFLDELLSPICAVWTPPPAGGAK